MARWGSTDFEQLKRLQENLNQFNKIDRQALCEKLSREIAARLLRMVIKRTPVGVYDKPVSFTTADGKQVFFTPHTGKKGGTLRRGWTGGKRNVDEHIKSLAIAKSGNLYVIAISNIVEYASFVEYGHRTPNHAGWVKGRFMLTISENEIKSIAPQLLEKRVKEAIEEAFNAQ